MEIKDEYFGKEIILNEEVVMNDSEIQKELDYDPYFQSFKKALKEFYRKKEDET